MTDLGRSRRPPPDFRLATVVGSSRRGPRLISITLGGPELVGFEVDAPAASVRLLLPRGGAGGELEIPTWSGNEFLFADGTRPPIRTLTPLRVDPVRGSIDVEVVLHGSGALGEWAGAVEPGGEVALSGPGAGYQLPVGVDRFLLVGDESALPAIAQLLEATPHSATVDVTIEVASPDGRIELPGHPGATVRWLVATEGHEPGAAMVDAVASSDPVDGAVWAAGEAAAVHRLRSIVLGDWGVPRSRAVIRGYWKHGRDGIGTAAPASDDHRLRSRPTG